MYAPVRNAPSQSQVPPTSTTPNRFARVLFRRYKALKHFSVTLNEFNVLAGPNNAGKSTIVSAFRILSEGMRIAASRKPAYHPSIESYGYRVPLRDLPIATENIFTDYDDSEAASIEFIMLSKDKLKLIFPHNEVCYLTCDPTGRAIMTPSQFKKVYNARVGFVPVLGPVEHNEPLYQKEAARLALLTHRASRNFRNIWHHYPEDFQEFQRLVTSTWPGMDVEMPRIDTSHEKPVLHMFCPEGRHLREIFWAGFGFQVWCQMLTYIVRARDASLLIIDEPDIYLHADLQRQLVEILKSRTSDILIATHSTEILSEVEPADLLVVDKKNQSAKRIKNSTQLPSIFNVLGSSLNPTLTQLSKSRRAIFVEGTDFKLFSAFARKAGYQTLGNQSDFAVIPVGGFNPSRVLDLSTGIETSLGVRIAKAVVFDRDFRSDEEVSCLLDDFRKFTTFAHIHERKEVENYLLVPSTIHRAINQEIGRRAARMRTATSAHDDTRALLLDLTSRLKSEVLAQFISKRGHYLSGSNPGLDDVTINTKLLDEFEGLWENLQKRLELVPGKVLLSTLNTHLQEAHGLTLTNASIMSAMRREEVPSDMLSLMESLEHFRCAPLP